MATLTTQNTFGVLKPDLQDHYRYVTGPVPAQIKVFSNPPGWSLKEKAFHHTVRYVHQETRSKLHFHLLIGTGAPRETLVP